METTTAAPETTTAPGTTTTTPPAAVTPVNFSSFVGEDGALKEGWDKAFGAPEGFGKKFTSLKSMIGSHASLERMQMSGNKVAIPGDNATPEEVEAFHSRVRGVKTADEYPVTTPEGMEGIAMDPEAIKEFKGLAFKHGMPVKGVQALADWYFQRTGKLIEGENARREKVHADAVGALEKDWGPKDGTKYREQLSLAEKGAAAAGLAGDVLKANPQLSNDPHFIRAMAKVGAMLGEKGAAALRGGGGDGFGQSIDAQIEAVMKSADYRSKDTATRQKAVDALEELYKKKFPS